MLLVPLPTQLKIARAPAWRLAIDGKDITREITRMVTSVTYTDHVHGKSDDLEIVIEDSAGRWRGAWYPTKGDKIELWIGYAGESILPCGRFEIDELELRGPPDELAIKALSTGIIPTLRTKRSNAYEGQTLAEVAGAVAARHNLRVVGEIEPIRIGRLTQRKEDDLTFLTRVAESYGYVFNVRGEQLIFYSVRAIEQHPVTVTIARKDVTAYQFSDKARETYASAEASYEDPATKELITRTATDASVTGGEVYKLDDRAENAAQAEAKAGAQLARLNGNKFKGGVSVQGETRLVAGAIVELIEWGAATGRYRAEQSVHRLTRREGYSTDVELKRVA